MTLYDLISLGLLAIFCFFGFSTGALRQVINLLAFFIAIPVAAMSKSWMANTFHLDNITSWIAAFVLFVVLFIGLRYLGHAMSDKLHKQKTLGYIDRILGIVIGVVFTLTAMGVFHLIFASITPIERRPDWFTSAKVYPISAKAAYTIKAVLPKGTGMADQVAPEVEK